MQKADELKLDRDPRVVQQLEAARREIVARAYLEKVGEARQPSPRPRRSRSTTTTSPALFKDRRIYSLQEIAIEAKPEQVAQLRAQARAARRTSPSSSST